MLLRLKSFQRVFEVAQAGEVDDCAEDEGDEHAPGDYAKFGAWDFVVKNGCN